MISEEFVNRLESGDVSYEELEELASFIEELSLVKLINDSPIEIDSQEIRGKKEVKKYIGRFVKIKNWKIYRRKVYLQATVDEREVKKWAAFLGCVGASTVASAALYAIITEEPVTKLVAASAVVVAWAWCMSLNSITPKMLKDANLTVISK